MITLIINYSIDPWIVNQWASPAKSQSQLGGAGNLINVN